ncbi:MAG: DUF3604 domain-containing protein [Pseudomonadales bacterium]
MPDNNSTLRLGNPVAKRSQFTKVSTVLLAALALLVTAVFASAEFQRTEQREPCEDFHDLKKPLFGDLHVHTRYSFDSYVSSQRNDPWDAYRYAKGEPITLPDEDGKQTVTAQLQRPLDFTAVTDHSELLGPINVCTEDPWTMGYWWPHCVMSRSSIYIVQLVAANWWASRAVTSPGGGQSFACTLSDCDSGHISYWNNIQQAAEDHYDRSSACEFTTFVGYEYTDAPEHKNMHRNVIFRNEYVTETAISTYDTGSYNFPDLWVQLREQCIDGIDGCDVLAIPHNPNLSGGLMFRDPETPLEATNRLFFEPVIELTQHKASSECRFDRLRGIGLDTEDELCDFEQAVADNLGMLGTLHGEVATDRAAPVELENFASRNMARNALKDGLKLDQRDGVNPFKFGFIGSTDTHSATPGGAEENNYVGHLGRRDSGYRNVQDHFFDNPGGHAVVWAEENSRDALFTGMRNKETYATSGTRPIVRFFAGWNYDESLCQADDMIEQAYAGGVPMGGNLKSGEQAQMPRFLLSAQKDSGSTGNPGTDLQRIQIVKGWVDSTGKTHERVVDVAGDPANGASVDPNSCKPVGVGASNLCSVWQDNEFDPTQNAFYYARVLENPSCRWSTLQCQAAGVNPFSDQCDVQANKATIDAQQRGAKGDVFGKCCLSPEKQPFYSPVLQERAWTSPIWIDARDEKVSKLD